MPAIGYASASNGGRHRGDNGDANQASYVDLLYVLEPGARLGFAINSLEDELAELFHRPVDLVSRWALHRLIRDDVLAEARTLYAA